LERLLLAVDESENGKFTAHIAGLIAGSRGMPITVLRALEGLGFTTELIEVALNLESIETLPSRRPLLVFNLVDAINCDGRFAPLVPERLDPLGIAYTG
jgi:hypothetical protein